MLTSSPRVSSVPMDSTAHVMGRSERSAKRGLRVDRRSESRPAGRARPAAARAAPRCAARPRGRSAQEPPLATAHRGRSPAPRDPLGHVAGEVVEPEGRVAVRVRADGVRARRAPRAHGPVAEAPGGAAADRARVAPGVAARRVHGRTRRRRSTRPRSAAGRRAARRSLASSRVTPLGGARPTSSAVAAPCARASPRRRRCGSACTRIVRGATRPSASQSDGPTAIAPPGRATRTSGASQPVRPSRQRRGARPGRHQAPRARSRRSPARSARPRRRPRRASPSATGTRHATTSAIAPAIARRTAPRRHFSTRSFSTPMPVDLDLERVARDERADALGRAREDHVARLERHHAAHVGDERRARRRSCASVAAVLPRLRRSTTQRTRACARVELRLDPRADGAEGVEALGARELDVLASAGRAR